jgi:hypothetical protein
MGIKALSGRNAVWKNGIEQGSDVLRAVDSKS